MNELIGWSFETCRKRVSGVKKFEEIDNSRMPWAHKTMPTRGRHQSSSKECYQIMRKIEAMDGVVAVIIGRSYGGKSLGRGIPTGGLKVQRKISGGLKAVTQSAKGLQEIFIRTESGSEDMVAAAILELS